LAWSARDGHEASRKQEWKPPARAALQHGRITRIAKGTMVAGTARDMAAKVASLTESNPGALREELSTALLC